MHERNEAVHAQYLRHLQQQSKQVLLLQFNYHLKTKLFPHIARLDITVGASKLNELIQKCRPDLHIRLRNEILERYNICYIAKDDFMHFVLATFIRTLTLAVTLPLAIEANALDNNRADIDITSSVNTMYVTINEGRSGCPASQKWHVPYGRCTTAVNLGSVSAGNQYRTISCPSPQSGTISQISSCTKTKYGWLLPPNSNESLSHYGAESCSPWSTISSSCVTTSPPPSGQSGPSSVTVTALICGSSDSGYSSGSLSNAIKNLIISAYKAHYNQLKRCPEESGFVFWQNQILSGIHTVDSAVNAIKTSSNPNAVTVANAACHIAANRIIGMGKFKSSTYKVGSGNKCTVVY